MQDDFGLTVQHVLRRAETVNGSASVSTLTATGISRTTYGAVAARARALAAGLTALGIVEGDRVGTFAWNTQEHLELYLGVPSAGAVLHTLNIRLFADQLRYIIEHARDRVIFVEDCLVPLLEPIAGKLSHVEHFVIIGDGGAGSLPRAMPYADLLTSPAVDLPELDERQAASLCYTSGTTGNPRGVLYSHRAIALHTMGLCAADSVGLGFRDRVMPVVPMFHVNAWGLPYGCAMTGAALILPGRHIQSERLAHTVETEQVTLTGGVPTVWMDVLRWADEHRPDLSSLRMVMCGGSAVPQVLLDGLGERHGVPVVQVWGMTELSPIGTVAHPPSGLDAETHARHQLSQGRLVPWVEARLTDDEDQAIACDGTSTGELEVRGPWVASAYYDDADGDSRFHDGWLRTGDIAAIAPDGYLFLHDRAKDVIKSGGEWISSVELENHLMAHPDVDECAVIARPDERWGERPLACLVARAGIDPHALITFLEVRVARW
jgi:fatty-acyl-CoA synthase